VIGKWLPVAFLQTVVSEKTDRQIPVSHKIIISDSQNSFSKPKGSSAQLISLLRITVCSELTRFQEAIGFLRDGNDSREIQPFSSWK
jgi:hypothetical protein